MAQLIFTYQTINQATESEFKDRGSKFFGYLFPINSITDCKKNITNLKAIHPKAVHHCFAYRIGITKNIFRASDDGEPSGSAGKPILGQIDSFEITNVLIVVVRYWGGTLLGVPGLINAYKTAAELCIKNAEIITKDVQIFYKLQYNYILLGSIMQIIKQVQANILSTEQQLFCITTISVPLKNNEQFASLVKEMHNLEYTQIVDFEN